MPRVPPLKSAGLQVIESRASPDTNEPVVTDVFGKQVVEPEELIVRSLNEIVMARVVIWPVSDRATKL